MKIEYHSTVIEIIKGDGWRKAMESQLPVLFKDDEDKISLLQFYSAFCDKDGNYLFNKGNAYYYPLTVVYKNNKWETRWISWDVDLSQNDKPREYPLWTECNVYVDYIPYCLYYNDITISLCDDKDIEPSWKEMLLNKDLFWSRRGHILPVICRVIKKYCMGNYGQNFVDAVSLQTEKQLIALYGDNLKTIKFQFNFDPAHDKLYVEHKGKKYLAFSLIGRLGYSIDICVSWDGETVTDSFINRDDELFTLDEYHPNGFAATPKEIKEFLVKQHGR